MGDTLNLATLARDSASPSGDTSGQEVVETSHQDSDSNIEFSTVRVCCTDQSARQYSDPIQLQETSTVRVCITDQSARLQPSAKGVCSCVQIASLSQTESSDPEIPTESEVKDLLLKLITQTKEQQSEMTALRLALKNGLEQLGTVVREFKGDIAQLQMQIKGTAQIFHDSDPRPLVKPFEPSGKENVGATQPTNLQKSELNLRLAGKQDVIQRTEASPVITAKAYKVNLKRIKQDSPSVHDADLSSTTESDEDAPCDTSNDSAASNSKLSSKKCQGHHPAKPSSRAGRWRQGGVQPTKSREDGFEPPRETAAVRMNADRMIEKALNQVPDAIHHNPKGKKTVVTLYAGNLDFKANRSDILETLRKHFKRRIQVHELTLANHHHGRSKGYGFITLSWAREAEVVPADICKLYSGMIQVKSRRLYFQELHDDVADNEHEKAYTIRNGLQRTCASGYCIGDGFFRTADGAYIVKWD